MPHRLVKLWTVSLHVLTENFHYVLSWLLIFFSDIPEPLIKLGLALLTGVFLAFGKGFGEWLWAEFKKRFNL